MHFYHRILKRALPRSVQEALELVPNRQHILSDFVKCYVDCIINQSISILTGDHKTNVLKDTDLVLHCYMETLLTRAIREVDNKNSVEIQPVDFYFIIHTQPVPGLCQKFLCDNMDEINLVFHCWLFQDAPFDPEETFIDQLDMGLFDPQGVQPVHQDLLDSGIEFGATSPR